jgi:serine/threonine protein kinase
VEPNRCPRCGTRRVEAVEGLCPGCLLRDGLLDVAAPAGTVRVVTALAESPWATCYIAEDPDDPGHLLVLKAMTSALDGEALAAEVEHLRDLSCRLRHRHVARVHHVGLDERRQPFAVTEFWPGLSITTYAARHQAPRSIRLALLEQAVSALEAAHAIGLVHGSPGASNVLVVGAATGPTVKVIDFGHARLVGRRHYASTPAQDLHALEELRTALLDSAPRD